MARRQEDFHFDKRQLTVSPSAIPAYASACSGSVRYSSACSCVGVTQSTITAVAPSTIVTVSTTLTVTSATQTTTDSTVSVTSTDATTFTTAIVSTETDTTIDATVTATITDTTTTEVTLATATCPVAPTKFYLEIVAGNTVGSYAQLIDGEAPEAGDNDMAFLTFGDEADATVFSLNSQGNVVTDGNLILSSVGAAQPVQVFTASDLSGFGGQALACTQCGTLSCSAWGSTIWYYCPGIQVMRLITEISDINPIYQCAGGAITLGLTPAS